MTGLLGLAITLALAAAAGGAANWAADVLPGRGANTDRPYCKALHYWTILWYPFRKGLCPHCAQPRPRRAPLLEVAVIIAFGVTWWRFAADPLHLAGLATADPAATPSLERLRHLEQEQAAFDASRRPARPGAQKDAGRGDARPGQFGGAPRPAQRRDDGIPDVPDKPSKAAEDLFKALFGKPDDEE